MIRPLFAAALLLLFLASWIFLPAPNRTLLTLGVGAPEVSPWLMLAGLVVLVLTIVGGDNARLKASRSTLATLVLSVAAIAIASTPLLRLPAVIRQSDASMRAALGDDFLRGVAPDLLARLRPSHFSVSDFVRGLDNGDARVTRGIVFAAPGGVQLTLDVYRPAAAGTFPCIVQIYGGAWQRGAPGDDAGFATYLASRGYVVFAIDYRHAPAWRFPSQLEDVRAALGWIHQHAGEHGGDASRLALLGRSAGAQLAMLAAYEAQPGAVAAVVSYYGPVDLEDGHYHPPVPDPLDVRTIDVAFLGDTPDRLPALYRAASPINHVARSNPPSLLIYGGRDHIIQPRYGARLDARLRAAGALSIYLEIPWAEHAFDKVPNGISAQLALYYTERFLAWAFSARA